MQIETLANNQTVVYTNEGKFFFSYDRLIAVKDMDMDMDNLYLTSLWDSSATTLKYLKTVFNLGMTKAEIQKALDNGEFLNYKEWKGDR